MFAMQYKQEVANVVSYASFQTKIDCLLRRYVLPHLARGRPNVVVFNEDVGLATIAIGSRGAAARNLFAQRGSPSCESQGAPCATLAALATLTAQYAVPLAAYHRRFGAFGGLEQAFVAATDTMVRSFMGTFSRLAKRYGVYMIGSGDVPGFVQSSAPSDAGVFADPDLHPRPASVYVATAPEVHNEVMMWGPRDVHRSGPDVLRNVVASNLKVPLTPLEVEIGFTPGPARGPAAVANLRPFSLPGTRVRIGFATSLPAFTWGVLPAGVDPCSDVSQYYMRCLDRLGANLVIQDEANPGRWTGPDGNGIEQWQPLSWMGSTFRTVTDPSVRFAYNVTPMMVGNLADLAFDGQSAIAQRSLWARVRVGRSARVGRRAGVGRPGRVARRGRRKWRLKRRGPGCHYIGNGSFVPGEDQAQFQSYAGAKHAFLAVAPWVVPDAPRSSLRAVGASLAPGSGSPLEDDYLETAVIADLPIPVDHRRPGCAD